jgi:hypothetical protein
MILGIASIPLVCAFGLGLLLGVAALILGIIALLAITKSPTQYSGKGMAITGIITGGVGGLAMIPLLIAILLPSLGKARELANRSVCAANLRGIGQSMAVYAVDNGGAYPIVSAAGGYGLAAAGAGTPNAKVDTLLSSDPGGLYAGSPAPSVTQNMWLLVLIGQVAPKQFLCKSDPAPSVTAVAAIAGNYQTNFNDGAKPSDFAYSYSFAYPWTTTTGKVGDWWKNTTDASLPIMADIAPMGTYAGTAAVPNDPTRREANSTNHQRDGQNVGFDDTHVEFARRPDVGQYGDNIYTFNAGTPSATGTAFTGGKAPGIGNGGMAGKWDICVVPVADASANYTRK